MYKKYLVFISSSLDDLKAERRELTRIVSEIGAIPISLEEFNIDQDGDRKIIRKAIAECDYFFNITAHKGGAAVGKSFALELEYSYALKAGIPVISLILDEKARWKDSKKEKDAAAVKALNAFKKKLEAHSFDTWTTMGDLRQKATGLLTREMNLCPRRGWTPSDMAVEPCVANELCRLLQENAFLKNQISMGEPNVERKIREQMKNVIKVLALNRISLSFYYTDGENWENPKPFRLIKLFRLLAPELNTPKTAGELSHFLGNILNPDLERTVRKEYPVPSNTIKKIMADFAILKLVKFAGAAYVSPDGKMDMEAWSITEYGKETYTDYRLRHMNAKLSNKNSSTKS